ncbi:MAG: hypothetical protein STHCBS139747_000670 [Sporothrix thermara]
MASSPETRPEGGVTDVAPIEKHGDTSQTSVGGDSSASSSDTKSATRTDAVVAKPPETDESAESTDSVPKTDPAKSSDESSPPQDGANGSPSSTTLPPLPNEPLPTDDDAAAPPPLPDEPLPDEKDEKDDGWDPVWSDEHQAWYFVNRFTQQTQWENPRVPDATADTGGTSVGAVVGGYNPAIHGDYDPTAWYATGGSAAVDDADDTDRAATGNNDDNTGIDPIAAAAAAAAAIIQNDSRRRGGSLADRHSHDAKASRLSNGYFDVAAAGNAHDGRSIKAERSGIRPSKSELKAFKEKRRARKEEKRRAWLRD